MAVISIRATGLGPQVVSGIPFLMSLATNVPATIYYTLDGSVPTVFSQVYIAPFEMPTESSAYVRAMAISGPDRGYFGAVYSTDSTDLVYPRRVDGHGLGIAVDAYGIATVLTDGYGPDMVGDIVVPVRSSDYELQDLEIKDSRTGPNGIGPGTIITMGIPPESQLEKSAEISMDPSSPNNDNVYFNPKSLYIVIDGRDGYEDQSVYIINRPWGDTLDVEKYLQGKMLYEPQPYISGGHVRTLYNNTTGTAVSYYFDHNETRWIKSIQSYDPRTVPSNIGLRSGNNPLVFEWVYNKRSGI